MNPLIIKTNYRAISGIFLVGCLFFFGCKKKESSSTASTQAPAPAAVPAPVVQEQPQEKPIYVYSGDNFRDPFMPAGVTTNYKADAVFDPQRAAVKGIIYGKEFKTAVVTVGATGSYFIKLGKIFDIMGKPVEGYSAKVFVDKVVLLGEADSVFELKIKNSNEEAKDL